MSEAALWTELLRLITEQDRITTLLAKSAAERLANGTIEKEPVTFTATLTGFCDLSNEAIPVVPLTEPITKVVDEDKEREAFEYWWAANFNMNNGKHMAVSAWLERARRG